MKINGNEYYYTYDLFNNIENIYFNGTLVNHYEYDPHSELIKDEDYRRGVTTTYEYDSVGNLLSKKIYDHSTETLLHQDVYMYENEDWEDQLTKYNDQEIHYDVIGNPISIGNDELVWKNGRQLYQYKDYEKNCTYTYRYDKDGIRTQKSSKEGTDIQYYLEEKNIVLEKRGNDMLYYVRDNNDELIGFEYNQEKYFYEKNAQDDIIALLDHSYSKVAIYQYDAWGKILSITDTQGNEITDSSHIAHINPFRYRSYYYDEETKLYYLNSRYYNPEWGRFLNADNYISNDTGIIGHNMYAYCNDNAINYHDRTGHGLGLLLGGAVAAGIIGWGILINSQQKKKKAKKEIKKVQEKNKNKKKVNSQKFKQTLEKNATKIEYETNGMNLIDRSLHIKKVANNKAIYDLKETPEWKNVTIYYDGMWMEPQDIGNYHFGYIGRAAGLPTVELILGAGLNQLSTWGTKTIDNCITPSLCDDYRDTYFIKLGAIAYDRDHKN